MKLSLTLFALLACSILFAQEQVDSLPPPLDDIVYQASVSQKHPLDFASLRAADVLWKSRIWRVIDTREKMNKIFQYPAASFFHLLTAAILDGTLTAYHPANDKFTTPIPSNQLKANLYQCDTFEIVDPTTYEVTIQVLCNSINPDDIVRYRIKEIRFFDANTARMQTRILGIAPLREVYDDMGRFKYEMPLFWVYYPDARKYLAKQTAFNPKNDSAPMTWEDIFEMRQFSSYIYKTSNLKNEPLQAHLTGMARLKEAQKLELSFFNLEQDFWSY